MRVSPAIVLVGPILICFPGATDSKHNASTKGRAPVAAKEGTRADAQRLEAWLDAKDIDDRREAIITSPGVPSAELADRRNPMAPRRMRIVRPHFGVDYKIRIIKPDPNVDYTIRVVRPDPNIDYRIRRIYPPGGDAYQTYLDGRGDRRRRIIIESPPGDPAE